MKMKIFVAAFCSLLLAPLVAAQEWTSGRPDGHAPIGVMADHTHSKGEFMFSYRFMHMGMEGSRVDSDTIDDADIVSPTGQNFIVAPTEMPMTMHMLGMMYAPTQDLTLMVMLPYTSFTMDHITRAGGAFTTESSGIGDVKVAGLYTLARPDRQRIHANVGVSIPTGSIEQVDANPMSMGNDVQLPYPMQIGSGTFDLMPGITYLGQVDNWSWGGQASAVVRLGTNSRDYTLGNVYQGTFWGARKLHEAFGASLRATVKNWGDIDGSDSFFDGGVGNRLVPTIFTDLRGGTRADASLGLNYSVGSGSLSGFRIGAEGGIPFYQSLDGPQLETDFVVTIGVQYAL